MSTTDISSLATSSLSDLGSGALVVLTAVIGLVVAYLLYKFAVRKIKGSVR